MFPDLDNPIWNALTSVDAGKNIGSHGLAYLDKEIAPFMGMNTWDENSQREIIRHAPPGRSWFLLIKGDVKFIEELEMISSIPLYQCFCPSINKSIAEKDCRIIPLSTTNVDEMIALTTITRPGPFRKRTIEFGNYHGIFEDGKLVAMGGERLHLNGLTEISAICTHPNFQGRGYGAAIVRYLTDAVMQKNEIPFLHARMDNIKALEVYKREGYEIRSEIQFYIFREKKPQDS